MTTRRWMLALAVIALLLAAGRCLKRRAEFMSLAKYHEQGARFFDIRAQLYTDSGGPFLNPVFFAADGTVKPEYAAIFRAKREHYEKLGKKYRYAAAHPWIAVAPDPPEP